MAKKKKNDDIKDDDNLNPEGQGDINEIDDSFGLPDVDFKPLDELDDVADEVSDEAEELVSAAEETIEDTAEDLEDTQEDASEYLESAASEASEEIYPAFKEDVDTSSDNEYQSGGTPVEDDRSYSELEEDAKASEKEYVPGSYTPPKDNSGRGGIIAFIIILLLGLIAGGVYYFTIYQPEQIKKEEAAQIAEQKKKDDAAAAKKKADEAKAKKIADDRQAEEEAAAAKEAEENKQGTVETISSRTGRYYVVVASNIDGDLALDYGNKISAESGVNVTIIKPFGKTKFHRIAVDASDDFEGAQSIANDLKAEYGDGVWVIKY